MNAIKLCQGTGTKINILDFFFLCETLYAL